MKVITVFKTHVDVGFTDLPTRVLDNYATKMLADAVETCEKTETNAEGEKFVWTLPAYPLYYALERTTEELKKRAEALIQKRRLVWHALPFTLRTEFFSKQELVDSLSYARKLSKRYGVPMPKAAKMTDVPGHTQALVDTLVESGITFLHLGSNPAVTRPEVPTLFWWESKNGNRILTYYNKDYGGKILPPEGWEFPVHLALIQTNDNCGVQPPEVIDELKAECEKALPKARFCVGTMDDFAEEILRLDLSGLPVVRGELGDSWIYALGHWPESVASVLEGRAIVDDLRKNLTKEQWTALGNYYETYLENALLFGEHSGGVDTKKYLANRFYEQSALKTALCSEEYLYANRGWNEERAWAHTSLETAKTMREVAKKQFGYCAKTQKGKRETERFSLCEKDDKLCVIDKATGEEFFVFYEYEVAGKKRIEKYLDDYIIHRFDWAIEDFGRKNYPDVSDETDGLTLVNTIRTDEGICLEYAPTRTGVAFGNAETIRVSASVLEDGVKVRVEVVKKAPSLYAEAGYLAFDFGRTPEKIAVQKSGIWVNPEEDIVKGASAQLFCAERVSFGKNEIVPVHAPLVSFGEGKLYRNLCERFTPICNGKVYFTLFWNMLGTGSPQWIEGDFVAEFIVSRKSS